MKVRQLLFGSCAALMLGTGIAQAGPCNTANKDAGSGPTPGHTANQTTGNQTTGNQTTGATPPSEHPPTSTMNRATDNVAASSQDTQKQMQAKPTAAQEAQSVKTTAGANDC